MRHDFANKDGYDAFKRATEDREGRTETQRKANNTLLCSRRLLTAKFVLLAN